MNSTDTKAAISGADDFAAHELQLFLKAHGTEKSEGEVGIRKLYSAEDVDYIVRRAFRAGFKARQTATGGVDGMYSIEHFTTEAGRGRNGYGLVITLAEPVVAAILEANEQRAAAPGFYAELLRHLQSSLNGIDRSYARLDYLGDTGLLLGMHVGSDCACFGVDGGRGEALARGQSALLRYDTHNIDTSEQAAAIVSTWLLWFNNIIASTDFTQPFTL